MTYPAISDESASPSGPIVGNIAKTVFMDGKPIVIEGSVNSAGATVLKPQLSRGVYVEGKELVTDSNILSDGSVILARKN